MKKLLYLFILFFTTLSFSQQEASKWYFGQGAALDFSSGTPTNLGGSLLNTNEGCSSFADSSGNLLFYIGAPNLTGVNLTIWDANDNPMPNANVAGGTGLNGDASSSQSALTVPDPNDSNRYFIFTVGAASSGNSGFWYYTLDMSLNGGLGDIVGGATPLHGAYASTWTEKVTAVKGADCNTFWVVSQFTDPAQPTRSVFWSYEVTTVGVSTTPVVSTVNQRATDVRGYLKVSPDGSKLATAHYAVGNTGGAPGILALYDFDNSTGAVNPASEEILMDSSRDPQDGSPYGLEFSSNSEKLYTSSFNGAIYGDVNKIFQFDLSSTDIEGSKTLINQRNNRFRGALQMALNKKIYATVPFSYSIGTRYLDVIENPSDAAADVIYTEDAVDLGSNLAMQGLPPFISSIFDEIELTGTDSNGIVTVLNGLELNLCVGDDLVVDPATLTGTPTYAWTQDGVAYSTNFNLSFTNLSISDSGVYELIVTYVDACGFSREESGSFTLTVHEQPTANPSPSPIRFCDDNNDGFMDFNLSDREIEILNGQSTATFEVLYFRDMARTDQITGADITTFNSSGQTIYARVVNLNSANCVADTDFDLEVYESAFPSTTVPLLGDCDNTSVGTDMDDIILFNLTDRATDILNGQSATDFTLTYFTDAAYTNQIPENAVPIVGNDITSYQNDPSLNDANGRQTIYVRMTNNATASFTTPCFTDTSFQIEVFELPTLLTTSVTLIQCNDDLTLIEEFNLRLKEDEISANFVSEIFTYYETFAEADAGGASGLIANPTAYPNDALFLPLGLDTVWVRVENNDGCHRVAQVNLDVNPSSAVMNNFVTREFSQCDDGTDNRDGVATFDFSSVTNDIQTLFGLLDVDVFYYETEAKANQGLTADQLDATNYDNISQDQLIWVQIVSEFGSDCLAKGQYVQLHVESLPTANAPTTVMKECDDDQDGIFPFDTSTITSEILNGQNLTDVTITYFNEDGTPISGVVNSNLPNPFSTTSQTIDIVVTNNTTNDPDGACTDATTLTFIVDALPINNVQPIPAQCETDPEDGLLIATFDTSNFESSINAQAGMDITYLDSNGNPLQDMDGNPIVSPFPNSFTTETQTITVLVTNPANTTCPSSVDVDFIVNPRPIFDDLEDDIVCENLLPHDIMVENPDASDYTYEWFNASGTSIGNSQILSIIDASDISTTGTDYTVTVTNPTTGCTRTKSVHLKKSSIATLLDEDIVTLEFNSPTNSIEIITTNLGSGDYEFALQHDSDSRPWQDEPIFTDLQGGMYTVLINDKNDCGEISKVIFLLDYPKFLTPNNDGYNDYWQLIGLDSTTFTISPIQIYDRFGKIVAIIDPTKGQGWDGLYNNEMLPSSDYWFSLTLTNNQGETIIKKGHFSLIRR